MTYEAIALLMFVSLMVLLMTGQRVFAAIGFVAAGMALLLYGTGGVEMPFNQAFKLFRWTAIVTLPLFIYMGYVLSEAGIAEDLYRMLHVWFGRIRGGLAIGSDHGGAELADQRLAFAACDVARDENQVAAAHKAQMLDEGHPLAA